MPQGTGSVCHVALSGGDETEETSGLFMKHLWNSRKVQSTLPVANLSQQMAFTV